MILVLGSWITFISIILFQHLQPPNTMLELEESMMLQREACESEYSATHVELKANTTTPNFAIPPQSYPSNTHKIWYPPSNGYHGIGKKKNCNKNGRSSKEGGRVDPNHFRGDGRAYPSYNCNRLNIIV